MPSENARLAMMRAVHILCGHLGELSEQQMAELLVRESGFGEVCEALERIYVIDVGQDDYPDIHDYRAAILMVRKISRAALAKARGEAPTEAAEEK